MPREVSGRALASFRRNDGVAPVPTEFAAALWFEDGVSASLYSSFVTENQQWANLSGTRGSLQLGDFVLPFSGRELAFEVHQPVFSASGCDFEMKPRVQRYAVPEHSHSHPTAQESNLFRNFSAQVRSGALNPLWPDIALKTQKVMAACLDSARQDGRPVRLA